MVRIVLLALGVVIAAVAGSVAWRVWPPLLRYRQDRLHARMRSVVESYLAGRQSLEPAAAQLAELYNEAGPIAFRLTMSQLAASQGQGSTAILDATPLVPDGYSPNDPRIDSLVSRAVILAAPPQVRSHMEEVMRNKRRPGERPPN